jgi:protein-tyrosine kinase
MAKIYEALQNYKQNYKLLPGPDFQEAGSNPGPSLPTLPPPQVVDNEREMAELFQNLEAALSQLPQKILLFIGSQEGEGTSTVARNFALFTAIRLRKKVLLLDGDPVNQTQLSFFEVSPVQSLEEVLREGEDPAKAFATTNDPGLTLALISRNGASWLQLAETGNLDTLWGNLKEKFDLILIDSPAPSVTPPGLLFCQQADGVILVVEADRTRGPVVEKAKAHILKNGGNILGIVFNKRRFYIPQGIYNRL